MSIQVLLADDHQIVREGLKVLLERQGCDVVAEASNGQQAVQMAEKFHPDVAVLDLAMPLLNGLDAAREIQNVSVKTKPIILTMHAENHYILEGLHAGAKGFVMKTHAAEDLVQAIREASGAGTSLTPKSSRTVGKASRDTS